MDSGPTWWQARRTAQRSAWFVLFETFRPNADPHAVLRVSASDGRAAHQGILSRDEVYSHAARCGPSGAKSDLLELLRAAVDWDDDLAARSISVEAEAVEGDKGSVVGANRFATVVVRPGKPQCTPIRLVLDTKTSCAAVVDRFMLYLANVHADLKARQPELEELVKEREQLAAEVKRAADKRVAYNDRVLFATATLIREKLKHAEQRPA